MHGALAADTDGLSDSIREQPRDAIGSKSSDRDGARWTEPAVALLLEVAEEIHAADGVQAALDRLAYLALDAVGADRSAILILEPTPRLRLVPGSAGSRNPNVPEWEKFLRMEPIDLSADPRLIELLQATRPVMLDDVGASSLVPEAWKEEWGSKSLGIAFLRAGGDVYGVLVVEFGSPHAFSEGETRLLDAIANAAGAAIRDARLVDQVKHGLEVQQRLFECCTALSSESSFDRVLDLVAEGFVSLLGAPHCLISLISPSRDRFISIVWRGMESVPSELLIEELPADDIDWLTRRWARDPQKPIVFKDMKALREWRQFIPKDCDVGLLIPLPHGDEVLGFVFAGRGSPFGEEELAIAGAFAAQAAVAVSRARIDRALKGRLKVNEALYKLSDLVVGASDVRALLSSLNRKVCRGIGIECVRASFVNPSLQDLLRLPPATEDEVALVAGWRRESGGKGGPPSREWIGNQLAFPIMLEKRVAGIIWVKADDHLGIEEIELLHAIAAGLGEVAHKAKLRKTAEKRSRELLLAVERERIARDLHDTVGQIFYGIGLRLQDVIHEISNPEATAKLEDLRLLATRGVDDVRSAVYALSFLHVRAKGLMPSLRALVRQFRIATGIDAEFRVEGNIPKVSEDAQGALYRMGHEALVNVDRHARATGVIVTISSDGNSVELSIRDDGVGIGQRQVRDWQSAAHFGLRMMAKSIEEIGGKFSMEKVRPRGLVIRGMVPVSERSRRQALVS